MPNKMLIDASHPEETRVVVVRGNRIEEFDFESQDKKQLKGNIYLARVTRVEPSLQAAFVEYGGNRHGFLAFSEIHPDYYQIPMADRQALLRADREAAEAEAEEDDEDEEGGERNRGRGRRRGNRNRNRQQDGRSAASGEASDDVIEAEDLGEESSGDDMPALTAFEVSEDAAEDAHSGTDDDSDDEAQSGLIEGDGGKPSSMAASIPGDVVSEEIESAGEGGGLAEIEEVSTGAESSEVESVGADDAVDEVRQHRKRQPRRTYKIQEVIKRRQILLVQVVKEERGNKGAALTTYLSLAGRYSVLMPNTARGGGISRKITNASDRKRLKDVVKELEVPQGMGVILRTAGESRTKAEIKRDYEYLMRLWENVRTLTLQSTAPALVYEEGSLIKRSVRDLYNKDIDDIQVAGEEGYREAKDFMRMLMPSHAKVVQPYRDNVPLFVRYGVESQLDKMLQAQVTLKSGGYLIINQTEALVAIDVNSGRSTKEHSIEDTALQTNLEAADEVARQLRLRDLAGLIVVDFIDMEENRNNRAVEKRMKDALKNDRARIQVGRISHFGLLEMSRQRIRASVLESTMQPCPHCGGTGHVRSDSSVGLLVLRAIEEHLLKDNRYHITVKTPFSTAIYVLNHKRRNLADLETKFGVTITIEADETVASQHYAIFRGAQIENPIVVSTQPVIVAPEIDEDDDIVEEIDDEAEGDDEAPEAAGEARSSGDGEPRRGESANGEGDRRRKRRRRRRGRNREGGEQQEAGDAEAFESEQAFGQSEDEQNDDAVAASTDGADAEPSDETVAADAADGGKRRRRGKRGGRRNRAEDGGVEVPAEDADGEAVAEAASADAEALAETVSETVAVAPAAETEVVAAPVAEEAPAKPARRSRKKAVAAEPEAAAPAEEAPAAAKPRSRSRKKVAEAPVEDVAVEETVAEAAPAAPEAVEPEPAAPAEPAEVAKPELPREARVVSSGSEEQAEDDKPRKGGWWQRRSFF